MTTIEQAHRDGRHATRDLWWNQTCPLCGVCRTCQGYGEVGICANDGKAGCSHINDDEFPCPDCHGTGVPSPDVTDLTEAASPLPDAKGQEPT